MCLSSSSSWSSPRWSSSRRRAMAAARRRAAAAAAAQRMRSLLLAHCRLHSPQHCGGPSRQPRCQPLSPSHSGCLSPPTGGSVPLPPTLAPAAHRPASDGGGPPSHRRRRDGHPSCHQCGCPASCRPCGRRAPTPCRRHACRGPQPAGSSRQTACGTHHLRARRGGQGSKGEGRALHCNGAPVRALGPAACLATA